MRNPGSNYVSRVISDDFDLVDVVEFYAPSQTSLTPANASKRFAQSTIVFSGYTYERQMVSRGTAFTYIDGKFNTCSVTLSNIDRSVGTWLASTNIKGYRLVIRKISRSEDTQSDVIFIGRCENVDNVENATVEISAKQDLGNIFVNLPFRTFSPTCQVAKGFKGVECLAGESLGSKSATYQAATSCDFAYETCVSYSNDKAFQGQRYVALKGNFKLHKGGFLGGASTKQWSSQDGNAKGKPVPLGFGRTQILATPVLYADTGQYLAGQWIFGEGPVNSILNFRNVSSGWATSFQAVATHLGNYGPNAGQAPSGFFSSAGMRHSHSAYAEVTIKGQNADTGDTAPDLVAVVLWQNVPYWNGTNWSSSAWSDNPAAAVRWLITDGRMLGYDTSWIDDAEAGKTYDYCTNPLIDQTGGEDLFLGNELSSSGGVDLIRYRSTGLIDTYHFRTILGIDATLPQIREASYNYVNVAVTASATAGTYYRRRWTANFHLTEKVPIADFLFKKLLPSFRGYLILGSDGKIKIKAEQPPTSQYLRASTSAGATSIAIENATDWMAITNPYIYGVVGVGLTTAEAFQVSTIQYSTVGNSVTLTGSTTGTLTVTLSGATLSGATTSTPATGTITIGGTITAGNVLTVNIDLHAVQYTVTAADTTGTVAGMIATIINCDANIKRYVKATWSSSSPTVVNLTCTLGILQLSAALANPHTAGEETANVAAVFTDDTIVKNSLKWPLATREDEYNQFTLKYFDAKADFSETTIFENDAARQATTNEPIVFEVPGDCVDNYHQANRLLVGARYTHGEDKYFVAWKAGGIATLLEVGDYVALTSSAMSTRPAAVLRIEDQKHESDHSVSLVARRYISSMFPESSAKTTISIETSVNWSTNNPPQPTSLTLTTPTANTIRGTFAFGIYQGTQYARVEVKKAGAGAFVDTGLRPRPDASGNGQFEITGLPPGSTDVKVYPVSFAGNEGTVSSTATTTVTGNLGTTYSFSAADPWTINHNLGYYPSVVCYDGSGNQITGTITNPTTNQTVVTFGVNKTGTARVY